jgi:aminoglycoside 6'-N-acetyltransferase I
MTDPLVRQADISDAPQIASMCALLWPDATAEEHRPEIEDLLITKRCGTLPATIFVSHDPDRSITGFLQAGLRSHADGCDPSKPVGFVEGWFVYEAFRRRGIGRSLMRAAENWARIHGCKEMASDTWINEITSFHAHEALGFEVVDHCIHFRKSLWIRTG